jgi:SAM-dependent methyltransferase
MAEDKYIKVNKSLWDWKTGVHVKSRFYDVENFKKGRSSLNFPEIEALGDVKDKSILHLQCHFGLDSLSFARMGAKVTGVDFSEKAIETAGSLNNELGLNAEFICTNIYDLKNVLDKKFDIVFTSYGVTCWLYDLNKWAEVISYFLKDDGMFYLVEFHPIVSMFDEKFEKLKYSYFNFAPIIEEQKGTYTDGGGDIVHLVYEWSHPVSEVISSLIKNNMKIVSFEEYPFSVYNCFKKMVKREHGYWEIEGLEDKIPMMFSVKAVKDSIK